MLSGRRRAKAVFDYLQSKGVASNRLKTMSFGESKPEASNKTAEGRAENRRVDLIIVK
jgi:outer membrane protein OmpA-like peptidoglycan-associated protein